MFRRWWSLLLLAALAVAPRGASGQCGMMGGSGHEHESAAKKGPSEKKVRQTVRQALAYDSGRQALLDEILADPDFVRLLTARVASAPEWRGLVERSLAEAAVSALPTGSASIPRNTPPHDSLRAAAPAAEPQLQAVYRCPMHPEVTSRSPGKCPKCGMTLMRDA